MKRITGTCRGLVAHTSLKGGKVEETMVPGFVWFVRLSLCRRKNRSKKGPRLGGNDGDFYVWKNNILKPEKKWRVDGTWIFLSNFRGVLYTRMEMLARRAQTKQEPGQIERKLSLSNLCLVLTWNIDWCSYQYKRWTARCLYSCLKKMT